MRGDGSTHGWRGEWYLYCSTRGEFVMRYGRAGRERPDDPDALFITWTPSARYALRYKNPDLAKRAERRINGKWAEGRVLQRRGDPHRGSRMVRMISMVTGEAARCLDLINQRDRGERP